MNIFSHTANGARDQNQDFFLVEEFSPENLFLSVADGVGGNQGGEVASRMASLHFYETLKAGKDMAECLCSAHEKVLNEANSSPLMRGMATTLSSVLINKRELNGIHIGDSRIYVLRSNGIQQLTIDHTEVAKLLSDGRITKEEAANYPRKNILYSAVGATKNFIFQEVSFLLEPHDRVLLMSDGAYSVISKKALRDLSLHKPNFNDFCNSVLSSVIAASPSDNYTIVGVEIE